MAALLGARLLHRDYLEARMGLVDTSGYGGGVSDRLETFTGLFSPDAQHEEVAIENRAADCWLLFRGAERELVGAMRMDSLASSAGTPGKAHDLFRSYQQGRSMREALREAETILRS